MEAFKWCLSYGYCAPARSKATIRCFSHNLKNVFDLADVLVRSSRKLFIYAIKRILTQSKHPQNILFHYENKIIGIEFPLRDQVLQ